MISGVRQDGEATMDLEAATALARRLLVDHGLHDWTVGLDFAARRAGACHFASCTISHSRALTALHDEDKVRGTVLHEITHVLVGRHHGHGPVWQFKAREIGCTAVRCLPPDAPGVGADWICTCPAGHEKTSHRKPERVASCARCATGFDPSALIAWTWRDIGVRMHPRYVTELVRLADRDCGTAAEQLAADALLGGRRGDPIVQSFLAPPLRLGSCVRMTTGRYAGTLVSRGRTRCRVQLPAGVLRITPGWIEAWS